MTLKKQLKQQLGKKATRRIYAAAPWVGGLLALAAGVAVQRRGVRRVVEDIRDLPSTVRDRAAGLSSSYTAERDRDLVGSR